MLPVLLKGQLSLESTKTRIRVLCLAESESVRGLQWALDRRTDLRFSFQLIPASLKGLHQYQGDEGFDVLVGMFDLGQPVPIEHLRPFSGIPALGCFQHPTPQQLLTLSEAGAWRAISWDGSDYGRLVDAIDLLAQARERDIRTQFFRETLNTWAKKVNNNPELIEWSNPPTGYAGTIRFMLDPERSFLSLSGLAPGAPFLVGQGIGGEFAELRFFKDRWSIKFVPGLSEVEFSGDPDFIRCGDSIVVGNKTFAFRPTKHEEELIHVSRNLGMLSESETDGEIKRQTLSEVCRGLLLSGKRGELRLASGLKSGVVYFMDSFIVHAVCGSTSGRKALLRMFSWEQPNWTFIDGKVPESQATDVRIGLTAFVQFHREWRAVWARIRNMAPPPTLKLHANAGRFHTKIDFRVDEFKILAAVCEYPLVRDILNNCPLDDTQIIEGLIEMRKQGLIEPVRAS